MIISAGTALCESLFLHMSSGVGVVVEVTRTRRSRASRVVEPKIPSPLLLAVDGSGATRKRRGTM